MSNKRDLPSGNYPGWLISPFVNLHLRVYRDPVLARSFLFPIIQQLNDHGMGKPSEIFDGDLSFIARGCFTQIWSSAKGLRTRQL